MKKKNNILIWCLVLLFATVMLAALPTEAEAKIYEDTLRLHILANSDSETDQELKLEIRDRLLLKYGELLKSNENMQEATESCERLLNDIENDVNSWINELGYSYNATAELTEEWYDTRAYEDFILPKGIYKSLKIIIASGEGKNWWCVMYPPLCMELATENAPADSLAIDYTKEEILLISEQKYNVKFKILEIVSEAFRKNG